MDAKKLKIANIVCWGIVVVLAIVLGVLVSTSKNYVVTKDLESVQAGNGSSSSQTSSSNSSSSQSGDSSGSDGSSSSSSGSNNSSGKSSTQDSDESTIEKLTASLKAEGYDTVVQGVVRIHNDNFEYKAINTAYFRLNEPASISGYKALEYETYSTQTIVPQPNTKNEFKTEDQILAYFSKLQGHQVLIGFHNGTHDVYFASGVSCNFGLHTNQECDLMNSGPVTSVYDFQVFDLG